VLQQILSLLDPADVVSFSRCSRDCWLFVFSGNEALWHTLWLTLFDDPSPRENLESWQTELLRRIKTRATVSTGKGQLIQPQLPDDLIEETLETLLTIHATSAPQPVSSNNIEFLDSLITDSVLAQSFWLNRTGWTNCDPKSRSFALSARLHSLHGPTLPDVGSSRTRGNARETVYLAWNFSESNEWGPLEKDGSGRVDWVLVEAATLVMRLNCIQANRDFAWDQRIILPIGFDSSRSGLNVVEEEEWGEDWAGVAQDWIGTYAFLGLLLLPFFSRCARATQS
jgi:hypothetical protein